MGNVQESIKCYRCIEAIQEPALVIFDCILHPG